MVWFWASEVGTEQVERPDYPHRSARLAIQTGVVADSSDALGGDSRPRREDPDATRDEPDQAGE
jgi:hypothetical protein